MATFVRTGFRKRGLVLSSKRFREFRASRKKVKLKERVRFDLSKIDLSRVDLSNHVNKYTIKGEIHK